jgi:hypothetical protein
VLDALYISSHREEFLCREQKLSFQMGLHHTPSVFAGEFYEKRFQVSEWWKHETDMFSVLLHAFMARYLNVFVWRQ